MPVIPVLLAVFATLLALGPLEFYASNWPRAVKVSLTAILALLRRFPEHRCVLRSVTGRRKAA